MSPQSRWELAKIIYVKTRDIFTHASVFLDAYDDSLNPYSGYSFGYTYCWYILIDIATYSD